MCFKGIEVRRLQAYPLRPSSRLSRKKILVSLLLCVISTEVPFYYFPSKKITGHTQTQNKFIRAPRTLAPTAPPDSVFLFMKYRDKNFFSIRLRSPVLRPGTCELKPLGPRLTPPRSHGPPEGYGLLL